MNALVSLDPVYEPGEFMAARMAMICCSVDITPVGILCEFGNLGGAADTVREGVWITIYGYITARSQEDEYGAWVEPVIVVNDIADTNEVIRCLYMQ